LLIQEKLLKSAPVVDMTMVSTLWRFGSGLVLIVGLTTTETSTPLRIF